MDKQRERERKLSLERIEKKKIEQQLQLEKNHEMKLMRSQSKQTWKTENLIVL